MPRQVPFYRHDLTAAHAEKLAKVLASPMLTSGSVGKQVDEQMKAFFGTKHAGLVNSWTNGAVAALLALDVGPGDEAIVPAMTFIASANVVELLGAKPVFVDVDRETLLLTPETAVAALTPRTKVIIPVHMYGQMMDVRRLREALDKVGRADVKIIEDCAHCFEGRYEDYGPGNHSDIAIFSFYATKNVTCAEGGGYVTDSDELATRMLQTRLHGMSAGAADRFKQGAYRHWDMARLGTKANLPDLLAALLPEQIDTIRARLPAREAIAARYVDALRDTPIRMPAMRQAARSAWHIFPIHVPPRIRDEAIAALNQEGVAVTVNYRSVPTLTYYRTKYGYTANDFPISYEWGEGTLTLPFFPSITREDQAHVIDILHKKVIPMCRQVG